MVPVFGRDDPRFAGGVGLLRDISAAGFRVYKSGRNDAALLRLETRMERFEIRDFVRDRARDADPRARTLVVAHVAAEELRLEGQPAALAAGERLVRDTDRVDDLAVARCRMDPIPPPEPAQAGGAARLA